MPRKDQKMPDRYTWLPYKAVHACIRLAKRHSDAFQEARHFMIDVAIFLAVMAYPSSGIRRTRQDLLDGLTMVSELKVLVESSEERLLREARRRGIPFREIADAMAMSSRQAAEQRFIRLVGGQGEAEKAHMNRRRKRRLGCIVDAQDRLEDHIENLTLAFRWMQLESHLPEEIVQEVEQDS
ncbi:hypothetical protein ACLB9X_03000 [Streptomyces sp. 5K101]|uniref:hypothetical protein n=1 Tax=Streptomyces sp. 5K101 TaxID=3390037 RepID=UPI003976E5DF